MSLGGGMGGTSSSSKSNTVNTTPWTGLTGVLSPTLVSGLTSIGSGTSTSQGIKALTASSDQQTALGTQALKSAFAGSGMSMSSDLMRSISQFSQQQSTNLGSQIATFQQTGIQDQLAALAEIISLAQGSSTSASTSSSSSFGWNVAGKLLA